MNQNSESIQAVVTVNMDKVSGGAPIFFARNEDDELENGTYIVVRHE